MDPFSPGDIGDIANLLQLLLELNLFLLTYFGDEDCAHSSHHHSKWPQKGEGILIWTQQNKFSLYDDESRLNQPPPANLGW
jgi:hypothetical protein